MVEKAGLTVRLKSWSDEIGSIVDESAVTFEDVASTSRQAHIVQARVKIWEWLYLKGWSINAIANLWEVDHTTVKRAFVSHGVKVKESQFTPKSSARKKRK